MKKIESEAFSSCGNLTDLYSLAENPPSMSISDDDPSIPYSAKIHVLPESLALYKAESSWKKYSLLNDIISPFTSTLYVGDTEKLSPKIPSWCSLKWVTSNKSVATVNNAGVVTPKSPGVVEVSAYLGTSNTYTIRLNGTNLYFSTKEVNSTYSLSATPEIFVIEHDEDDDYITEKQQYRITGINGKKVGHERGGWNFVDTEDNIWYIESIEGAPTNILNGDYYRLKGFGVDNVGAGMGVYTDKPRDNFLWNVERVQTSTEITSTDILWGTYRITIKNPYINLNIQDKVLSPDETLQLAVTKDPSDMSVKWSSSNTSVATVTSEGLVTAKKNGTTTITVTSTNNPALHATCVITVVTRSLSLNKTNVVLKEKETLQLTATTSRNDALTWESSDTHVASVSNSGLVTALKPGIAEITVSYASAPSTKVSCIINVMAEDLVYVGGIYYRLEGSDAIVTNMLGTEIAKAGLNIPRAEYAGTINIPESINYAGKTYSVTEIDTHAFYFMEQLQSLVLPKSIRKISRSACEKCPILSRLIFMNAAESQLGLIDEKAFYECEKLDNVTIPGSVHTIGNSAFRYCSSLKTLSLTDGLNMIDEYAFANCTALDKLVLPSTVSTVQNYAFAYDGALAYIETPASLQGIGAYCFTECNYLAQVKFKTTISTMTVGSNAFKGCTRLDRVDIVNMAAWAHTNFNDELANPLSLAHNLYLNNTLVTDAIIPIGTMYINNNVFSGCTSLKSVSIPSTVQYINDNIFYGCKNLKTVKCFATTVPPFIGAEDPAKMNNVFNQATLYVPTATVSQYQNDSWWKRFSSIQGTNEKEPDGVHTVTMGSTNIEHYYNLHGQRMEKPTQGLNIVNGHKVLVR